MSYPIDTEVEDLYAWFDGLYFSWEVDADVCFCPECDKQRERFLKRVSERLLAKFEIGGLDAI